MALVKPEVYSSLVREKVAGKVKILQLAKELENIDEFREVGETINFPVWSYIGDATTLELKGTITPSELVQLDSQAVVTHVAKGVTIYDRENLTAIGNQLDEGADQLAVAIARKLDTDLIAEMTAEAVLKLPVVGATAVTEDELFDALGLFGDEQDTELFSGIVINSKLMKSFYAMPSFVSATNTMSVDGNGIPRNGLFGYFRGISVFVSDKGTYDTLECVTYIIKNGAIGYKSKRNILIEEERVASQKRTDIFADMLYAVKLLDPSGLVIVRKTIA
ncbi:MAG: hypothetical protein SCL54_14985 [Bacillota bacterium]|nr:hypothetical protein [Bacillota bacterium]